MFGISLPELLVIFVLALVVLGPEKLPEVARWLGKGVREIHKASNLMRDAIMLEEDDYRARQRRQRQLDRPRTDEEAGGALVTDMPSTTEASTKHASSNEPVVTPAGNIADLEAAEAVVSSSNEGSSNEVAFREEIAFEGGMALDQLDDSRLSAQFERALREGYGIERNRVRRVP